MKIPACKKRILDWLHQALILNFDKKKYKADTPVATNGFILNLMDVLLILCKPFVSNFEKYGNFISKVNCFYLFDDSSISTANKFDRVTDSMDDFKII